MQIDRDYLPQKLLRREFEQRKKRNSFYSLRAFACDLCLGSTTLSDVLARKRKLSPRNIQKILQKMALSETEKDGLLKANRDFVAHDEQRILQLEDDTFRLISDWYHFAILSLASLPVNFGSPLWISERLNIPAATAAKALETLKRLDLLEVINGKMIPTDRPLATTRDVPNEAIRNYHRENLELAKKSLNEDPVELRDFSTITMAINPDKLKEAKDYITKAKRKVCQILETGTPTQVYTLAIQLFPLTKSQPQTQSPEIKELQ